MQAPETLGYYKATQLNAANVNVEDTWEAGAHTDAVLARGLHANELGTLVRVRLSRFLARCMRSCFGA